MESLEVTAKTVEEAIELALKELGVDREEVDVVVVTEGRSGILGIGGEPARVRVTPTEKTAHHVTLAKEILEEMLERMEVDASVRLKEGDPLDNPLSLDISGDDSGLLIGRGGASLSALQFLVNFMVSRKLKEWSPVNIDVEGYKQRKQRSLEALAHRLAKRVQNSGRPFTLEPMPASDRRIIHMTLADDAHVTTESTGFGDGRRVSIQPKAQDLTP